MKPRSILWLQLTTCLSLLISTEAVRELVFVQAIWRHGDRAPLSLPYPKDPYTESAWQRGWQQLTNLGMNQLNELGRYFRATYSDFIASHYIPSQVYIRSSDSDRALTSAQAFLSGFYPAEGSFQWQPGNTWQPIPIHASTPGEPDLLLKPTSTNCKEYDALVEADDAEQAEVYNKKYADLFKLLGNQTGIANFSYVNINRIYNVERELIHNMTEKQPEWVFKKWSEYDGKGTMEIIGELRRIRMMTKFNSPEKAMTNKGFRDVRVINGYDKEEEEPKKNSRTLRLAKGVGHNLLVVDDGDSVYMGSYLLNNLIENALKVANGSMKNPDKMLLYSSHDGTVLGLMYAMNVANDLMIPYAAALIMEIYKDGDEYFAELLYRNDTSKPAYKVPIPWCGDPCTVKKLGDYPTTLLSSYAEQQNLCGTPLPECKGTPTTASYVLSAVMVIMVFL
ncbi:histidine acid phosphatase [Ancylostoma caninum]|uniref:Histidine acid phosphatase n=1 Tax=Ancylostoma caninum TaxID=29170 RepID=A0A368GUD7_ANCCA|nr:histidine acid phosphatase [Ancylostoma caninum]